MRPNQMLAAKPKTAQDKNDVLNHTDKHYVAILRRPRKMALIWILFQINGSNFVLLQFHAVRPFKDGRWRRDTLTYKFANNHQLFT
jgi:hypothetical protein